MSLVPLATPTPVVDTIHPNLKKLSNNATNLVEACPRLFELDRLSPSRNEAGENVHLDFGSLVGNMVQSYLVTGDMQATVWEAFLSYPRELFSVEVDEEEKRHKKDFWYAMYALEKFTAYRRDVIGEYSVAILDNRPAVELGFSISCPSGFSYRGKLDAFLVNRREQFAILECKTTSSRSIHEAMFRNSGQGIGYSAIVDTIANKLGLQQRESFPIYYPVYKTHSYEWEDYKFYKSKTSHANWIKHLLRTIQHVAEYAEDSYFPMHGQNCFHFGRACKYYEQCEMQNKYLVGESPAVKVDKEEDYTFHFTLDELIDAQLSKVSS